MLILVRHGQSAANAGGLLVGRLDSPLTDLGRLQAARVGEALAASVPLRPSRLLASPLRRARETAEIIAGLLGEAPPLEVEHRLIELDYGEYDGRPPTEIGESTWTAWRSDPSFHPPGGESFVELHRRLDPLWEELAASASTGDVIVVTHVSPIKAAVAWALEAGPELAWKLSLGVAAITRLNISGADGTSRALVSFGETGHLAGLPAR